MPQKLLVVKNSCCFGAVVLLLLLFLATFIGDGLATNGDLTAKTGADGNSSSNAKGKEEPGDSTSALLDEEKHLQLIEVSLLKDNAGDNNSSKIVNEKVVKIEASAFHYVCALSAKLSGQHKTMKTVENILGKSTEIVHFMESVCEIRGGLKALHGHWKVLEPRFHEVLSKFFEDKKLLENLKRAENEKGGNDLKTVEKNPLAFDPLGRHGQKKKNVKEQELLNPRAEGLKAKFQRKIFNGIVDKVVKGQAAKDDGHRGQLIAWVTKFASNFSSLSSSPSAMFEHFHTLWKIMETRPQISRRKRAGEGNNNNHSPWIVALIVVFLLYFKSAVPEFGFGIADSLVVVGDAVNSIFSCLLIVCGFVAAIFFGSRFW